MKLIFAAIAMIWATSASADGFTNRQIAFHALSAADAVSTCVSLDQGHQEMNMFMGRRPSCGKVVAFAVGTSVIQELVLRAINRKDPEAAKYIQYGLLVTRAGAIALNVKLVL